MKTRTEVELKAAPKDVGWGTTNTPLIERIDPSKTYKTRSGKSLISLRIVLHNSCGNEVTFPVKASIDMGPRRQPRYKIWTLRGEAQLFGESPDDLIEVCDESVLDARLASQRANIRNGYLVASIEEMESGKLQQGNHGAACLQEMIDTCKKQGVTNFGDTV